jgi:hypothetical protein
MARGCVPAVAAPPYKVVGPSHGASTSTVTIRSSRGSRRKSSPARSWEPTVRTRCVNVTYAVIPRRGSLSTASGVLSGLDATPRRRATESSSRARSGP